MSYNAASGYNVGAYNGGAALGDYNAAIPYDAAIFYNGIEIIEPQAPSGGGEYAPRKPRRRPAWIVPPQFYKPVTGPLEEDEALLLCGVL